jgi:hypothetical protein
VTSSAAIDPGVKIERIPSFEELNRMFASIDVPDDELRSAAEISWLHGDPRDDGGRDEDER